MFLFSDSYFSKLNIFTSWIGTFDEISRLINNESLLCRRVTVKMCFISDSVFCHSHRLVCGQKIKSFKNLLSHFEQKYLECDKFLRLFDS